MRLPLELVYEILIHVPLSQYAVLYEVLPEDVVHRAIQQKLGRQAGGSPLLQLVSTNVHELAAPCRTPFTKHNESALPLYYERVDLARSVVCLQPGSLAFFEVKDYYVSHGKLVVRHSPAHHRSIASLWDIRCRFLSSKKSSSTTFEMTIHHPNTTNGTPTIALDATCSIDPDSCRLPPRRIIASPWHASANCGYFFVNNLTIHLPDFLALFT
ncbi:hypothetical protein BC940DRAFT_293813 [Gongronella butleri]|nr:hypothetical protein BC940DRAFT_293813 [Gongronella butleri]